MPSYRMPAQSLMMMAQKISSLFPFDMPIQGKAIDSLGTHTCSQWVLIKKINLSISTFPDLPENQFDSNKLRSLQKLSFLFYLTALNFGMVRALNMFLIFDSTFSTESFFRHIFFAEPHPSASNLKDSVLSHTKFIYLEPADIYTWTRFFFNFSSFPLNPICSSDVQLTKL